MENNNNSFWTPQLEKICDGMEGVSQELHNSFTPEQVKLFKMLHGDRGVAHGIMVDICSRDEEPTDMDEGVFEMIEGFTQINASEVSDRN